VLLIIRDISRLVADCKFGDNCITVLLDEDQRTIQICHIEGNLDKFYDLFHISSKAVFFDVLLNLEGLTIVEDT
jgi:hypothetical protein